MKTNHFTKLYKKFDAQDAIKGRYCTKCGTFDATTQHRDHYSEAVCDECDYNYRNGVSEYRDTQYATYENLFI